MSGYAKLFSSILHSTIWLEESHVRLVWITMLAMANRKGVVEASIPGLAVAARVSLDECQEALTKFMSPDKHSRTKDHDGRRIAEVDGGWVLLNYEKHREMQSKAAKSERQARWRAKKEAEKESTERLTVDANANNGVVEASTAGSASASGSKEEEVQVDGSSNRYDQSGRPLPRKPVFPEMVKREDYEPSPGMAQWAEGLGLTHSDRENLLRDLKDKHGLRPHTLDWWDERWLRFAETVVSNKRPSVSRERLPPGIEVVSGGRS